MEAAGKKNRRVKETKVTTVGSRKDFESQVSAQRMGANPAHPTDGKAFPLTSLSPNPA
jgi:hypothetical protein